MAELKPQWQEGAWQTFAHEKVLEILNSRLSGLQEEEALARLKQYGRNELTEEGKVTRLQIFVRQFKSVLIFILILVAIFHSLSGNTSILLPFLSFSPSTRSWDSIRNGRRSGR